jgi:hypothetical protein
MRDTHDSRRALTAGVVIALTLAVGRAPTAVASPSAHTNARNPAVRILFPGRGCRIVGATVEVRGARPAAVHDTERRSHRRDRDDAQPARDPRTSDRAALERPGKESRHLDRPPDASDGVDRSGRDRSLAAASPPAAALGARHAAREAVFHEAHAPPRHS